jgi:hypothetical protein
VWHVVSVIDFPHEEEELMFLGNSSTHFRQAEQVQNPEQSKIQQSTPATSLHPLFVFLLLFMMMYIQL